MNSTDSVNTVQTAYNAFLEAGSRVLVTGGTGFVGWHLLEALSAQKVQLRVLARRTSDVTHLTELQAERIEGGLDDRVALAHAVHGVDVVFHLAAVTRARSEREYHEANAEGTRTLVETLLAAQRRPRRLVYLSSLAAAGPANQGQPVGLSDAPRPITAYGRSKLVGEQCCLAAGEQLEVVILRAPAVYGPRDRDLFLGFRLAARGILFVPRGPERLLQFIHVTDLVEALIRAAVVPQATGIYHVAEAQAYGWSEITHWIAKAMNRQVCAVRIPQWTVRAAAAVSEFAAAIGGQATIFNREKARELLAPGWLCETEAAKRDLGFEGRIPLPVGLTGTAAWYREQGWL
ncbi:MAG: NAD(P)-dependent oxidoreductase [Deltaproteobacteria bacterium]|nr:NAD(P)-dependent oxidoreductase [Deltaproteobacteria bacterium]